MLETLALSKALLFLDELKIDTVEAVVSGHIRSLLESALNSQREYEQEYTAALRTLLDLLSSIVAARDPVLEKQISMLVLLLTPPVSPQELHTFRDYFSVISQHIALTGNAPNAAAASAPLTLSPKAPVVAQPQKDAVLQRDAAKPPVTAVSASPPQEVAPASRDQFKQRSQDVAEIRSTLARNVDEAIAQNEEFGVMLEVELDALRDAGRSQDLEKRRVTLVNQVNMFIKNHRLLSDKFASASKCLKLLESSNRQLNEELEHVRLLSLTDELTGLPNQRAFLHRIEEEVGRVKRYGTSASMTFIGLDGFDLRGPGKGDAVFLGYKEQVLSIFRHHDLVARYDGESFAVFLPNTNREGAMRAIQKLQVRVAEVTCTYNGERLPMPTFSAGLAEYHHGETTGNLIERADAALNKAKRQGKNRIEYARDPAEATMSSVGHRDDDLNARLGRT